VILGTNQPIVIFTQQPYFNVPHADPTVTISAPGYVVIAYFAYKCRCYAKLEKN